MKKATIELYRCIQESQEYGSDDEYMISHIFFRLEVEGKTYDLHSDLKQLVGSNIEDPQSIEVGRPEGYEGPFNYAAFQKEAADYFKECIGAKGKGIGISGGSNVFMENNIIGIKKRVVIDIPD